MSDKPVQKELFDLDTIPATESKPQPTRWYYITRRRRQEMLHYVSRDGAAVWCEHDTREVQPMLFNSAYTAKLAARKHGGDVVERWYWSLRKRSELGGK